MSKKEKTHLEGFFQEKYWCPLFGNIPFVDGAKCSAIYEFSAIIYKARTFLGAMFVFPSCLSCPTLDEMQTEIAHELNQYCKVDRLPDNITPEQIDLKEVLGFSDVQILAARNLHYRNLLINESSEIRKATEYIIWFYSRNHGGPWPGLHRHIHIDMDNDQAAAVMAISMSYLGMREIVRNKQFDMKHLLRRADDYLDGAKNIRLKETDFDRLKARQDLLEAQPDIKRSTRWKNRTNPHYQETELMKRIAMDYILKCKENNDKPIIQEAENIIKEYFQVLPDGRVVLHFGKNTIRDRIKGLFPEHSRHGGRPRGRRHTYTGYPVRSNKVTS